MKYSNVSLRKLKERQPHLIALGTSRASIGTMVRSWQKVLIISNTYSLKLMDLIYSNPRFGQLDEVNPGYS